MTKSVASSTAKMLDVLDSSGIGVPGSALARAV
jgi:hypothetical protein